nr:immunoglobulin heavy chain junction region [Macaca mulatta]
CARATTYDYW